MVYSARVGLFFIVLLLLLFVDDVVGLKIPMMGSVKIRKFAF
jgi:hypothetical protein